MASSDSPPPFMPPLPCCDIPPTFLSLISTSDKRTLFLLSIRRRQYKTKSSNNIGQRCVSLLMRKTSAALRLPVGAYGKMVEALWNRVEIPIDFEPLTMVLKL